MRNHIDIPPQCFVDTDNEYEIVLHFRDLINMGHMLDIDYELEIIKFQNRLYSHGWSRDKIAMMMHRACFATIYEAILPHIMPERGDWYEYQRNRYKTR